MGFYVSLPKFFVEQDANGTKHIGYTRAQAMGTNVTRSVSFKVNHNNEHRALLNGDIVDDHFVWDDGNNNIHYCPTAKIQEFSEDPEISLSVRTWMKLRLQGQKVPFPADDNTIEAAQPAAA